MKLNTLRSVVLMAITASVFTGCVDSDKDYEIVNQSIVTYDLTANKTVASLNSVATTLPKLYPDDDIIEAYVVSTDGAGHFYKSISLQTIPQDATAPIGFSLAIDETMLFAKGYTPGRKIFIKLKGLSYAKVFGSMQIGVADPNDPAAIMRIPELDFDKYIFPSSEIVSEDSFVRTMTLADAVTDANQNTLIELTNVQFSDNDLAKPLYDPANDLGGSATNHEIVDVTTGGRTRFLRVSSFATFSSVIVPTGRGSIRGVMTKFNQDYQFIVRGLSDFKLDSPRNYTFFATLNENFNTYTNSTANYNQYTSFVAFPNYLNFTTQGTKKWFIKSNMLEMSSFSGNTERNKSYFVVPVDMTAANAIKFDVTVGFISSALGLKVYRSMDFVPGKSISDATLFDISTSLSAPLPSANGTYTNLTYNIPASVTGNGYFIFEYTGTNISTGPVQTTTVDLDNIVVN